MKVTDEAFIALWNRSQSATQVALDTGLNLRSVFQRRAAIEAKGIPLPSLGKGDAKMVLAARRDVNTLAIENGVIVVGSDAHYSPGRLSVAHKAMCNLITDLGSACSAVILNGDILDGGSISRHGRIRWKKTPSVLEELDAVRQRLTEIELSIKPGTPLLRTYGNHCGRFETKLSNMVPQFEGVSGFLLRDHFPLWADSERIDINDDTVVIHDWHSGVHSGWNDVIKGGCNVVTGHTHELGAKAHRGFKGTHYGIKTGMLADEDQDEFDYRQGKPGFNWQSGFAVLTWRDGMMLHPEFCAVRDDGRAYFRGQLYAD